MYKQVGSLRPPASNGTTEFDVLKASHKFLRDDDDVEGVGNGNASWEDRLAQKYYASLYREFAVCDLKHYKSGNFALRWRTEAEVISSAGEETCGNTRCAQHVPPSAASSAASRPVGLKTVELPFAYDEHGERKSALVKVVLCAACLKKLMWKHERDKEKRKANGEGAERTREVKEEEDGDARVPAEQEDVERVRSSRKARNEEYERRGHGRPREQIEEGIRQRRSSRSLSPSARRRRDYKDKIKRRERSPSK